MEDVRKNIYESWLKCYNNINFITQNINVKELHLPQADHCVKHRRRIKRDHICRH